mmetsp:Transcript_73982/g.239171  ORF Transcript_73982/g.239171 Transcript_73982/m.239171 type:complete len:286 (+) Transcript_73982:83-940(+)
MRSYGASSKGKAPRAGPYTKPASGDAARAALSNGADDDSRMVYVANLPFSAEWQELKDFFSQAGTVEYARILSTDGNTVSTKGRSRGIGYVRFSTADEAENAVSLLNGAEMDGRTLNVDVWTSSPRSQDTPRVGIRSHVGKGGWTPKGGERRAVAPAPRPRAPGGKGAGAGRGMISGDDDELMVYVSNLPFTAEWQELKDLFSQIGTVEYARVLSTDGNTISTRGRSRGVGYVKFSTAEEAQAAIDTLNGIEMDGRTLVVDAWTTKPAGSKGGKGTGKTRKGKGT